MLECFFKQCDFFKNIFFLNIVIKTLSLEKENIIKDIRNYFRLKKNKQKQKHLKMEYLKILRIFWSKKKKKNYKKTVKRSNCY